MIDLVAVQALLALEQHGTVVGAAGATGYTPSAVSQQIKRLERDLGVRLLEPAGRGVVLTEAGRRLAVHGARLVAEAQSAVAAVARAEGPPRGTVRLVAFSTAVRGLIAPALARAAVDWPHLHLHVVEKDPFEAVDLLAAGQADLAVVHNWVGVALHRPARLVGDEIGEDVADLLVPAGHRLEGRGTVTPADLVDEIWASTSPGTICHGWFTHMFSGFPRAPQVRFWCWEFASQVQLVQAGVAVALVPRLGRGPLPPGVVAVPVVDPVPRRVVEVLHRATSDGPALRAVTALLREFAPRGPVGCATDRHDPVARCRAGD